MEDRSHSISIRLGTSGGPQAAGDLRGVAGATEQLGRSATNTQANLSKMRDAGNQLYGQLVRLAALAGTGIGIAGLLTTGIQYNRTLEDSKTSIAAVIASQEQYRGSANGLRDALVKTEEVQKALRSDALTTAATYEELVQTFTQSVGPAYAAGIRDTDKIRQVTIAASQTMQALGIDSRQSAQEIRAMFTGEQGPDNRLNQTLRITKAELAAVRARGGDLAEYYLQKMKPYTEAAALASQSFTVRLSNLKDVMGQVMGEASKPIFDTLKTQISGVGETVSTFKERFNEMGKQGAEVLRQLAPLLTPLLALVISFVEASLKLAAALAPVVPYLVDFMNAATAVMNQTGPLVPLVVALALGWGKLTAAGVLVSGMFVNLTGAIVSATGVAGLFASGLGGIVVAAGAAVAALGVLYALWMEEEDKAAKSAENARVTIVKAFTDIQFKAEDAGKTGLAEWAKGMVEDFLAGRKSVDEMIKALRTAQGELQHVSGALKGPPGTEQKTKEQLEEQRKELERLTKETEANLKVARDAQKEREQGAEQYLSALRKIREEQGLATAEKIKLDADAKRSEIDKAAASVNLTVLSLQQIVALYREAEKAKAEITKQEQAALAKDMNPGVYVKTTAEGLAGLRTALQKARGEWSAVWADMNVTAAKSVSEFRQRLRAFATSLLESVDASKSYVAGVVAGVADILASIPTQAESARNATVAIWQSMARGFDESFYSVLSGKMEDIGDIWDSVWDGILRAFASVLSDMLQRWLTQLFTMESAAKAADLSPGGSYEAEMAAAHGGPAAPSGGGGFSMAGAQGWGIAGAGVAGIAQIGNGRYNATGAYIGAGVGAAVGVGIGIAGGASLGTALGSSAGPIGALIGAIVGLLVGILASPNTEKHVQGVFDSMLSGYASVWVPEGAPPTTGDTPYTSGGGHRGGFLPTDGWGGYGDPTRRDTWGAGGVMPGSGPGHWEQRRDPVSDFERAGRDTIQRISATMADVFRVAAPDSAREFARSYQKALHDILGQASFDIAAGSDEDITKNIQNFMRGVLPKLALQAGFGQYGYGPSGNRDSPGGIPGLDWNLGNSEWMDAQGNWVKKQLFDPNAPIPLMLSGLGVTAERIGEIATRLASDDPEKFLVYLKSLVGVLVGFRELGKELAKTREELFVDFRKESTQSPAESFKKPAAAIQDLFASLDLYSGDEQLAKAGEALAMTRQFWDEMRNAAREVWALMQQLSASIQGQRVAMRDTLAVLLDPSKAEQMARETVEAVWGKLAQATTPEQVAAAAKEAQDAAQFLFNTLIERIKEAQALLASTGALATDFRALGASGQPGQVMGTSQTAVQAAFAGAGAIQNQVATAATLSGQAQVDAIRKVEAAAREMYASQQAAIAAIDANAKALTTSIEQQKFGMRFDTLSKEEQGASVLDRVKSLMGGIAGAGSPEEIKAITDQIQQLVSQYWSMLPAENKEAARGILDSILDETQRMAQEAYAKMRAELVSANEQIAKALEAAGVLLADNVAAAAKEVGDITHFLGGLDEVIRTKLGGMVDEILAAGEALRLEMEKQAGLFTGTLQPATSGAANALGGEGGLTATATASAEAQGRVAAAADRATGALDRLAAKIDALVGAQGGAPTGPTPANVGGDPGATQRAVAAILTTQRRIPRLAFGMTGS